MTRTSPPATPSEDSGLHHLGRLPTHSLRRLPETPLDGHWDFQLLASPGSPTKEQWRKVQVPSLWTMDPQVRLTGADRPHYTNVAMPFDQVPPHVPDANPPGVYRRTVRLAPQPGRPAGTRDGLRVGIAFELVDGFERAHWIGLGPWENYPDRQASALLGSWEAAIDELAVPYLVPQENGTRGQVTDLLLSGPAGTARTRHTVPLHANIGRHTVTELEAASHWWRLPPNRTTIVHLDIAHRGVGTGGLGPDTRPAHRLTGDHYTWEWRLTLKPHR
jgi:hypothetical protein